jgi:2-polyprenyl-3-methyl-5-hydroxy-6-metoxy-1,4-benzoquinol methylase
MSELARVLEPEVMDTEEDATEYDAIHNDEVNGIFAARTIELAPQVGVVLDMGAGPGDIAIMLAERAAGLSIQAIDLAEHMLVLARRKIAAAGVAERVTVSRRDVKDTGFPSASFDMIVSNSLVHHIPEPRDFFREVVRLARPNAGIFIKDLLRPRTQIELDRMVEMYAGDCNEYQRLLFHNSLHAALRVEEVEQLCRDAGLVGVAVSQVSDHHWAVERAWRLW